ncbi:MAG: N-acetylmuramic acid 6-phosphate etherase [Rhodospirillaceae bacterium]|jgi:N-acetylmuramic acid 6-phosphate etherase|nr:N-acetylmuramic acid 6-phosphate etherase [Rhodospirillaceae bacterium]
MTKTEAISQRYRGLDIWADEEILEALWEGQARAIAAVRPAMPAIAGAARAIAQRLGVDGRIIYAGAGSSGGLAALDGMELGPTFGWPNERVVLIVAGGEALKPGAHGNAEDDAAEAERRMAALKPGAADVLIVVAASGSTRFSLAAVEAARRAGSLTVGLANNPGAPLLSLVDYPILLDSGAEVISGSTRMNAGTAQKAALNLLSTLAMIRLGHVYDGLMVNLRVENAKLHERAVGMLTDITGCRREAAAHSLEQCGGHVKSAALVLNGAAPAEASHLLAQAGGDLRRALIKLAARGGRSGIS